jgi:hypothetical protein
MSTIARRQLLIWTAGGAAAFALGCSKKSAPLSCTDTTGLAAADLQARTALAYEDASTDPTKTCTKCLQYNAAPAEGSCGTCKVVKGPINPNGSCKAFAPKPA